MDRLPLATAFAEHFCQQHGVARADSLRLALIIEELFTNTITHGQGDDSDAPVHVELRVEAKHLHLCYEDNAPPFDPGSIQETLPADVGAELDERRVGGLGVQLMLQMAHSLDYAYVEGFNRLQLVLKREP